jgi:transposase
MIRSGTVHTIHELATQGKSGREIATSVGLARNTVRKYLRGSPPAAARRTRGSQLDPFKEQIGRWMEEDHLYNCEVMLTRLRGLGYQGGRSILKAYVHPQRPAAAGKRPVIRYETPPGQQMQFDWGECVYERDGVRRKVYGFIAILSYSRMRYARFVKRCDVPTLMRCLLEAFDYFGGLPKAVLTDQMKSVLLKMEHKVPLWHPVFADLVSSLGIAPRVCKAFTPQTKGKVERSVSVLKHNFWPGVRFRDLDDLNRQALVWCDRLNQHVHQTTHQPPIDRWVEEVLMPLPAEAVWQRFGTEDRKVSWDGYVSYDGVLYGLPSEPAVAGKVVQVYEHVGILTVWWQGKRLLQVHKRAQSQTTIPHPEQFRTVASAAQSNQGSQPLGHQVPGATVEVAQRPLQEYDRLFGLQVVGGVQ